MDWPLAGGLLLLMLFLAPTLHMGFRGDDTWSTETKGQIEQAGQSFWGFMWDTVSNFWSSGRPNPLAPVQGFTFAYLLNDQPMLTHAVMILATGLAAAMAYALARELGLSRTAGLVMLAVLAGALQLRAYHDPLTTYWATTQIVLGLTLASLVQLVRGLRRGENRRLVWSFLLFLPCPLFYEVAYPLVALHVAVAFSERRGMAAVRVAAPFLALGAAFIALSLAMRLTATNLVPGYEVSSSPWAVLRTFLIQLVAPIPGSTLIFRGEYANFFALGDSPTKAELLAGAWRGAVVFGVVLAGGLRMAWSQAAGRLPAPGALARLAVIGGLLWTVSVLAVAAAPKYQVELVAGKGHLPTIIQTFGWAMVIVAALLALVRSAHARSRLAVVTVVASAAALLGFGAAVDGYNNVRVVALEVPVTKAREVLENGMQHGAVAELPPESTLLFSPKDLQWYTGNFAQNPGAMQGMLFDRTGRVYDSRPISPDTRLDCRRAETSPACLAPLGGPAAAWVRVRTHPGGGSVIVGRIDQASPRVDRSVTRSLRVYTQSDDTRTPPPPEVVGTSASGRPWKSARLDWTRVSDGDGWAVYEAVVSGTPPLASSLDDAHARVDFMALPDSDGIVRIYGTKSLLP